MRRLTRTAPVKTGKNNEKNQQLTLDNFYVP
jgi:hypothetical protein